MINIYQFGEQVWLEEKYTRLALDQIARESHWSPSVGLLQVIEGRFK